MSIFHTTPIPCPKCGKNVDFYLCHSINADRRPDLRDVILDGSFQRETCGKCKTSFRMEPEFTYLDNARNQWIVAKPIDELQHWEEAEAEAQRVWDVAWGKEASAAARAMMKKVKPRITFGWNALVEKIALNDKGMDDVAMEIVKAGVLRGVAGNPIGADTELRYTGESVGEDAEGDELEIIELVWMQSKTAEFMKGLNVPKMLYDEIVADPFLALRLEFGGLFVDLNKLYLASTPST